jgi:hypothetical protein
VGVWSQVVGFFVGAFGSRCEDIFTFNLLFKDIP